MSIYTENNVVCMEVFMGRNVLQVAEFESSDDFGSLRDAESWLHHRGYSYGSTDVGTVIAISKKLDYPFSQKWCNFLNSNKKKIDGAIVSGNFRNGPVKVYLFDYSKQHRGLIQDWNFGIGLDKCTLDFRKRILEGRDKVKMTDIKNIAFDKQVLTGSIDSKLTLHLISQGIH